MTLASNYSYQPLSQPRFIRLLTLSPSPSPSKPIRCHLRQASLDDASKTYEALSYTWGARNGTVPISCDGQTLLVTPNCESALRHLRNRLTSRVLWVDAVCIDQGSAEEKSTQVPLMGDIYALASQVVVWLGQGVPEDEALLRRARIGGRLCYVRGVPDNETLFSPRTRKWVSKAMTDNEMEVIRRIGGNAWFGRLWTIQELLLASSAVFQIGHTHCSTVSLYTYFLVAQALEHADLAELSLFRMRSQVLEVLQPQSDTVKAMYVKLRVATRSAEGDHQEMLATALRLAILCGAADPRDKAYGMFGLLRALASNDATLPYVDYAKPVAEVYEDMARALIRIGKSLWPLEIIARTPGVTALTSTKNLPSWVPDLQDPSAIDVDWRPALIRAVTSDRELNVPDHSKLHSKLKARIAERRGPGYKVTPEMVLPGTEAPGQLQVQVRHLAEVSQVYGRMPSAGRMGMPDGDALRTVCLSEWAAAALAGQDDDGVVPVESLAALESLTPALDYIRRRHSPAEAEDLSPSAAASRSGSRRRQDQHQPVSMYDGAALFRTTCGLLGLCKGDVRPGDRVWQLAGGRYPFVLRRELVSPKRSALTSWSARPRDKVYSLVGIADVCGLDAETRESAARWEKDHVEAHFHEITLV